MQIKQITQNKKQFLPLLLLGDEQESMIDRYLERGDLFALYDPDCKTICVVTKEGPGIYEIKNIATSPHAQRQGYGQKMVQFVLNYYQPWAHTFLVGTGDSPLTLSFYQKCGFQVCHRISNFFINHYDHAIYENGKQLIDMVYLKKELSAQK